MAQPQPQMPQRQLSPQGSPSPASTQPGFALPPNKRPRLSPGPPSQPQSPYASSPYAASPGPPVTPSTAATSAPSPTLPVSQQPNGQHQPQPQHQTQTQLQPQQLPQQLQQQQPQLQPQQQQHAPATTYSTPYTNGNGSTTPSLALPENRPTPPPPGTPTTQPPALPTAPNMPNNSPYTNATFGPPAMPVTSSPSTPLPQQQYQQPLYQHAQQQQQQQQQPQQQSPAQGAMGPPSRPPERQQKEYEYDVTDSLAGTGIDLRAEEQYLAELYAVDPSVSESRTGFSIHPPGTKASFYGAGSANQPAAPSGGKAQDEVAARAAEKAWQESAKRLASERTVELKSAFLKVPVMQSRAEAIAKEHGLTLNWEMKGNQSMGRMKAVDEPPRPVHVSTKVGPEGALVKTSGCWIPPDAYLADQLALLSIATKQRLRSLVGESNRIAANRQKTSHGEVPEEWKAAAGPLGMAVPEPMEVEPGTQEGASGSDSLKRPLPAVQTAEARRATKVQKISNANASTVSAMMRDLGRTEREWEEARLRRRNARKDGTKDAGSTTSRATSVAPGTPGGAAPDGEKAMTKKEQKKLEAAKKAEASSHANQNLTSGKFLGMNRPGGLFGKKAGKSYSWMTGGGSGTSTPTKPGAPGKAGGTPGPSAQPAAPSALTVEGSAHRRPGAWREDKEKGKNVQLRDWVAALEEDGTEVRALQRAYNQLDSSWPKQ